MNKNNFTMFLAGVAIGVAGNLLYNEIRVHADYTICEEPKVFELSDKNIIEEDLDSDEHKAILAKVKPDLTDYIEKIKTTGYTNYALYDTDISSQVEQEYKTIPDISDLDRPYTISPDAYGDCDYDQIELTYYSDGILADDEDEVVDDIDAAVGTDFAEHFGDYEADVVYIRNDRRKCDYEICKDYRSYTEVAGMYSEYMEG